MGAQVVRLECGHAVPQPRAEGTGRDGGREFGQSAEQETLLERGELVGVGREGFELPVEFRLLGFRPEARSGEPEGGRVAGFLLGRGEGGERGLRVPVALILGRQCDPHRDLFGLLRPQGFEPLPRLRRVALEGEKPGPEDANVRVLREILLGHPEGFLGRGPVPLVGGRLEGFDHLESRDLHVRTAEASVFQFDVRLQRRVRLAERRLGLGNSQHRGDPQRVGRVNGHGLAERLQPPVGDAQLFVTPTQEQAGLPGEGGIVGGVPSHVIEAQRRIDPLALQHQDAPLLVLGLNGGQPAALQLVECLGGTGCVSGTNLVVEEREYERGRVGDRLQPFLDHGDGFLLMSLFRFQRGQRQINARRLGVFRQTRLEDAVRFRGRGLCVLRLARAGELVTAEPRHVRHGEDDIEFVRRESLGVRDGLRDRVGHLLVRLQFLGFRDGLRRDTRLLAESPKGAPVFRDQ